MKKSIIIGSLIAFYVIFTIVYFLFFAQIGLYLLFIAIGSVAILSPATIYAVIEHVGNGQNREIEKKVLPKPKFKPKKINQIPRKEEIETSDTVEEYFKAMPYLEEYVNSDQPYEDIPIIKDLIFSTMEPKDLANVNLLDLTKFEKIEFLRELVYYDPEERTNLIESMLKNRGRIADEVIYKPPTKIIEIGEAIRAYIISLIEKGEKSKLLVINTTESIKSVKERAGELFNHDLNDFLISTGGLILDENKEIKHYDIEDEDEIVLIPKKKEK